jgi:hypothetical protein
MCGVGLNPKTSVGHSARQVFDLPQPQPLFVTGRQRVNRCVFRRLSRADSARTSPSTLSKTEIQ